MTDQARDETGRFSRSDGIFTVPAAGKTGNKTTLSVQVDPALARRIQDICYEGLSTGRWPWRTPGEVHRYLLVVGLSEFAKTIDVEDDTVRFHQISHTVGGWTTNRQAAEQLRDQIIIEVQHLLNVERQDDAIQRIHLIVPDILRLDDTVWREWLVHQLRITFPRLFEAEMPFARLIGLRPEDVLATKPKKRSAAAAARRADLKRKVTRTVKRVKGSGRNKRPKKKRKSARPSRA